MAEMAARGVVGFKAFMCDSGLPEFPRADDVTLLEGMREAARLGLPVAVHAESEETDAASSRRRTTGRGRPRLPRLATGRRRARGDPARAAAGRRDRRQRCTSCTSAPAAASRVAAEARARGVDVSIETCPHYLFFTDEDIERLGAVAKCAPPLRATRGAATRSGTSC